MTNGTGPLGITSGPLASFVREWLDYHSGTGVFRWKKKPGNHIDAGAVAGTVDDNGYLVIKMKRKRYLAHRLAWIWVHGEWPNLLVDHIDGNKLNNRLANLRLANHSQNALNRGARLGRKDIPVFAGGVSKERYRARIYVNGKSIHLGSFDTEAEAHAAYVRAVEFYKKDSAHASQF